MSQTVVTQWQISVTRTPTYELLVAEVDQRPVPVIRLYGEVDVSSVEVLDSALRAATAESPCRVVVDMGEVSFMGSTGLNCLIRHHQRGRFDLVVRAPSSCIRKVLAVTGLDGVFTVVRTDPLKECAPVTGPDPLLVIGRRTCEWTTSGPTGASWRGR